MIQEADIAAVLCGILVFGVVLLLARRLLAGGVQYRRSDDDWVPDQPPLPLDMPVPFARPVRGDAADQLRIVMRSAYQPKRIMNVGEYKLFVTIESELAKLELPFRVHAQTCLGEILSSPDEEGFRGINAKRVDMLVVDRRGMPVLAVEYQGEGHYQNDAAARDSIKREALRRAGIRYLDVLSGDSEEQTRLRLRENLAAGTPVAGFGRRSAQA